jgi:hypothetical protein
LHSEALLAVFERPIRLLHFATVMALNLAPR